MTLVNIARTALLEGVVEDVFGEAARELPAIVMRLTSVPEMCGRIPCLDGFGLERGILAEASEADGGIGHGPAGTGERDATDGAAGRAEKPPETGGSGR